MRILIGCVLAVAAGGWVAPVRAEAAAMESVDFAESFGECAFAEPPAVMDGMTARTGEMNDWSEAVREYMKSMEESLKCLDATEQELADRLSDEQRAAVTAIYNNGVDQMNFVAKEFNRQQKIFDLSNRDFTADDVPR